MTKFNQSIQYQQPVLIKLQTFYYRIPDAKVSNVNEKYRVSKQRKSSLSIHSFYYIYTILADSLTTWSACLSRYVIYIKTYEYY